MKSVYVGEWVADFLRVYFIDNSTVRYQSIKDGTGNPILIPSRPKFECKLLDN